MVQTFQLVTQHTRHTLDGILRTYHHDAVAHLQGQATCRKQVHTRTVDARHVHAIHAAEMQLTHRLTVDRRLRHQDTARHHRLVFRILVFPIDFNLRTDESLDSFRIVFGAYDVHLISDMKHGFRCRDMHFTVLQDTRTYQVTRQEVLQLQDGLSVQSRILHTELDAERFQVRIGFFSLLDSFRLFV